MSQCRDWSLYITWGKGGGDFGYVTIKFSLSPLIGRKALRVARAFLNYLKSELSGVVGVTESNREESDIIVLYFRFCEFHLLRILSVCTSNNNNVTWK